MDAWEDLDPVLKKNEFDEIVDLLLCHGLHKDLPNLLTEIIEKLPEFDGKLTSPFRQILVLLAFCNKFQQNGPLPDIKDHSFLYNLHEGVVGFLKAEPSLVELMSPASTYKLVGGLRLLLARSILMSSKFLPKDVETTIANYFPTFPVKPSNSKSWENWADILQINLEEKSCEVLKQVNKVNSVSAKHLTEKLNNLPVERRKSNLDVDDSVIIVWKSVAPKFDEFVRHLRSLLPENFLDKIASNSHPKIKMLASRIPPNASEGDVIAFFDYICDVEMETKFWTSSFVQQIISPVER
eukprot:GFUD01022010.1.p1 GENE.GFUD01022010.1~~GFUD01022010.1.p1  ORF type:complete len:296 (-),score=61.80 GFUD01022010.1:22-909(-)